MSEDANGSGPSTAVVRQSSGDQVAAHIRRLIFTGELRQGDRIRQNEIADELGVSRIPVREAIIALDREGWVTIEPHRGAFVLGLDESAVRDHYDILGRIYGLVARRAVAKADDAQVGALAAIVKEATAAQEAADFFRGATGFWHQLFVMADSPRLTAIMRVMPTLVPDNFFAAVPSAEDVQRKGMGAILRAVRTRDADAAAAQCIKLLEKQAANVVKQLELRRDTRATA